MEASGSKYNRYKSGLLVLFFVIFPLLCIAKTLDTAEIPAAVICHTLDRVWTNHRSVIHGSNKWTKEEGEIFINLSKDTVKKIKIECCYDWIDILHSLPSETRSNCIGIDKGGISIMIHKVSMNADQTVIEFGLSVYYGDDAIFQYWYEYRLVEGNWKMFIEDFYGVAFTCSKGSKFRLA
mgnify:CR=1 FL=1